ncbi:mechanosensitive ion channel family protein, partial [bacterium]|nr:mechanosensitive ion channel family protein [bacterium]
MSDNWSEIVNVETLVRWFASSGLRIVLVLVGALVAVRLAVFITRRVEQAFQDNDPSTMNEREKQAATLGKVIRNITRILVWSVAVMMVLRELGIDIGPILAGIGIMGLAVG